MKYLVNRETKEHRIADSETVRTLAVNALATGGPEPDRVYRADGIWDVIQADAEGWIKWDGGECPLPDDCEFSYVYNGGEQGKGIASEYDWRHKYIYSNIVRYRPILDNPDSDQIAKDAGMTASENYENQCKRLGFDPEQQCDDIISRLKSAHEAAQTIPDLLAELREVLGSMGYDVVARNPFVERTDAESGVVESESGTETLQGMSDWRNWKPGDLVTWQPGATTYQWWTPGKLYEVKSRNGNLVVIADDGGAYSVSGERLSGGARFRFHSRPEKK